MDFLRTLKQQCLSLRASMANEVKQRLKFLVLNAVHAKKLKEVHRRAEHLE